jgi:predicted nucleotidyltransferase
MGEHDRALAEELKRRLPADAARHLHRLILFGSRARGDAAEDADLDLVALVDEKTPDLEQALDTTAYDVMWDHNFRPVISLKVFAEERFRDAVARGLSFYCNVEREGVVI